MAQNSTEQKLERQVKELYQLAKERCDDESLQLAVDVIKTMRRSRGSLQAWNQRYREGIECLHEDIQAQEDLNRSLQRELNQLSDEMRAMTLEKKRILQDRRKAIQQKEFLTQELRQIEIEVNVTAKKVQSTKSLFGKFSIMWSFFQSTFFSDDPQDYGVIDNSFEADPEKPQLGSGISDIQRDLLDR
ncbi:hypothetical protein [[Leptolyngbya] sp. PCC 7376]|uniref:hypothetical protein n=1 Tax=[Leptolyngbya] sp. PCC 7376 TaxID=111781 RepID=UPI00059F5A84|nr:hypothetical protein [[Leptolyngbya] sp. PCC 7376]